MRPRYVTRNGWTVAEMHAAVEAGNLGRKSERVEGCAYLAPDGNRCAVGCFLSEEDAAALWDITQVASVLLRTYTGLATSMPLSPGALDALQRVHDTLPDTAGDPRPYIHAWIDAHVRDARRVRGRQPRLS